MNLTFKEIFFENVVKRKLTFFSHMLRNKKFTIIKEILQGKIEGKRRKEGQGCPISTI